MAQIVYNPTFQAFADDGGFLVGGLLYTYAAGTSTPKTTWSAPTESAPNENANPIVLDSRGEAIFYGSGAYKFVLKTAAGATIWTADNVTIGGTVNTADIADGAVTTPKLATNVLSADTDGRSKMEDGFVTSAKLAVVALPNGSTATTQSSDDNSTKVATTAYSDAGDAATLAASQAARVVVSEVFTSISSEITVSTPIIPLDTSKPQISEGTQVASVAITPESTSHKVELSATFSVHSSAAVTLTAAVFRNGATDAVYAVAKDMLTAELAQMTLLFEDSPASASEVTYTIRIGPQTLSGTQLVNKSTYSLGGLLVSNISLKEIN